MSEGIGGCGCAGGTLGMHGQLPARCLWKRGEAPERTGSNKDGQLTVLYLRKHWKAPEEVTRKAEGRSLLAALYSIYHVLILTSGKTTAACWLATIALVQT